MNSKRALRRRIAELEAENARLRGASIRPGPVEIRCDGELIQKALLQLKRRNGGEGLGLA